LAEVNQHGDQHCGAASDYSRAARHRRREILEFGRAVIEPVVQRRNRDLDPQLVWRGKDEQDWSDLVVNVPPLYIQEKVHPKALIDELLRPRGERLPTGEIEFPVRSERGSRPQESQADCSGARPSTRAGSLLRELLSKT
jgi:hypothetical protein